MHKRISVLAGIVLTLLLTSAALVSAQEGASDTAPGRESVAVTIYNQGTALVQDRRVFTFDAGSNLLNFTDVAASIDPTSVTFVSTTDPEGTTVLEQNYVYDLVDSTALLQRYLDETIQVTTEDGNLFEGQLLSGRNEIILRTNDGQVIAISPDHVRDLKFPNLPDGLITRPTLRWLVDSAQAGENKVELTYLTYGINWSADYNVLLATDNQSLDINGWVTLNNNSGTAYPDATVKLVAGDVNRLPDIQDQRVYAMEAAAADYGAVPAVEQREFFEYQLYEIARHVNIGNNETKQVEFVAGTGVTSHTYFVYDASLPFYGYSSYIVDPGYWQTGVTDVKNYLEFSTGEESGLGADLPAGNIRVYQEDVDGSALLIGENRIDHTPEGETVEIFLGNAFDLVGERTQTNFNIVSANVIEETFEIRLRNRKDSDTVQIRVPERLTRGSNWEITASSHDYEKKDAFGIEFRVDVPAGEETVITYTVRYTRPR